MLRNYYAELTRLGVSGYSFEDLEWHTHLATCHFMTSLLFLDDEPDFVGRKDDPDRSDFTSQRVLAAAGRDEVIAAVERV